MNAPSRLNYPTHGNPAPTAWQVKARADELGFIACGITNLDPIPHGDHLDRWLKSAYAGNMRYIHRQARKRKNPQLADRQANCAIVVLDNYYYTETTDQPHRDQQVKLARYARGEDYHRNTFERLQALAAYLIDGGAATARPYLDTGPLQERELAQRAGLGWIGKNTMLIRPGVGSWFFIGCVLTDLALELDAPFTSDHCGSCTQCLDACPTGAFVEPRMLDATRCISYATIEQKGAIGAELASHMAGWAFGCDICNEVCPWNERFAVNSSITAFRPRPEPDTADPSYFAAMSDEEFAARFADTPLARPGLERMRRNWAAAFRSIGG
ncbi:MAG: tRNA epoxyqueuosine(34) reductase QueG [Gemmatimonadota bacterium]|nr:tRNA epoxyqueuosine(34) reductase QueG [Gemmatimonadota bacterium]